MRSRDVLCLTCGFLAGVVATSVAVAYGAKKAFEFFDTGLMQDKIADVCLTAIYGGPSKRKGDKFYQYRRPYYTNPRDAERMNYSAYRRYNPEDMED